MSHQFSFNIKTHGGPRRGAGRPRLREHDAPHVARPKLNERTPFSVTLRFVEDVPSLRDPHFMMKFTRAIEKSRAKGLCVNHFSVESNHIHLTGEAAGNDAVTRGMLSLQGCITWALRKVFNYFGNVFDGRFHLRALRSPREVRNALLYVIFNHAKHCGVGFFADAYSSAHAFTELRDFVRRPGRPPPWQAEIESALSPARSWLQTVGWKR